MLPLILLSGPIVYDEKHQYRKLQKYVRLINPKREVFFYPATDSFYCTNTTADFDLPTNHKCEWKPFDASNTLLFNSTKKNWFAFKAKISIPSEFNSSEHLLRLTFQIKRKYRVRRWDDDFPAGPEGRIFLNGDVVGAIDEFHDSHIVNSGGDVEVRIYTGRCLSEHQLIKFGISIIHKDTEALWHRLRFIKELSKQLDDSNLDKQRLFDITNEVVSQINIQDIIADIPLHAPRVRDINATDFYQSIPNALKLLKERLKSMPQPLETDPVINVIGYSHLDTCWEWPYNLSHYKFSNTAASMLHLMEYFPHDFQNPIKWHFLGTSAQHYKWAQKDDPKIYQKIMNSSQWNIDGVSWIEPDTNLPGGESLIRQLLIGAKFFESIGHKQTTFMVPDCFGFTAALPQLLKLSGIDQFITSKISWNEYTDFPYSSFVWRGVDGSEVLAHFITTPCKWAGQSATYTGEATARELIGTFSQYKQKSEGIALHTAGNGDGGGGLTEDMLWNLNTLNELPRIEGVPKLRFPTLNESFQAMRENRNRLPRWDGELYLEYHRGTATTQEEVKKQNRRLEASLHNCEVLAVMLNVITSENISKYSQIINEAWEETLLFQFHDALPGTSVNEANVDIIRRGQKVLKQLDQIEKELTKKLSSNMRTSTEDNTTIIFNTLSTERNIDGVKVPSIGWAMAVNHSKRMNVRNTTMTELLIDDSSIEFDITDEVMDTTRKEQFETENFTISNSEISVTFSKENGSILSIIDKSNGRNYLRGEGNLLEYYEDRPVNWPAWDIQLYHKEMLIENGKLLNLTFENDSVFVSRKIGNSVVNQTITMAGRVIDFNTKVDWREHDKLLKVAFKTNIRSPSAKYGIQFGSIDRPTHANREHDMAMFEVSGRWSDLCDATGGLALMSDVKAGFDIHGRTIRMSLLKAPLQTDMWADYGRRQFVYRLAVHKANDMNLHHLSNDLNFHPMSTEYEQPTEPMKKTAIPMTATFAFSSSEAVIIDTLKPAEDGDGFILRAYESMGGWTKASISLPFVDSSKYSVEVVDLMEHKIDQSVHFEKGAYAKIELEFQAFQIISLRLKLK